MPNLLWLVRMESCLISVMGLQISSGQLNLDIFTHEANKYGLFKGNQDENVICAYLLFEAVRNSTMSLNSTNYLINANWGRSLLINDKTG